MTIRTKHLARFWGLYAIGLSVLASLVIARFFVAPDKFDWPAWVQAVGSISAILAAVWVSTDQADQQRRREKERGDLEVEGVLRSLQAEVESSLRYLDREVAPILEVIEPGNAIQHTFHLPESPFAIFDSLIPKLGLIPNPALQRKIIHSYALGKSAVMTTQLHNRLVKDFEDVANVAIEESPPDIRKKFARTYSGMNEYSQALRNSFNEARRGFRELEHALAVACGDPQN